MSDFGRVSVPGLHKVVANCAQCGTPCEAWVVGATPPWCQSCLDRELQRRIDEARRPEVQTPPDSPLPVVRRVTGEDA